MPTRAWRAFERTLEYPLYRLKGTGRFELDRPFHHLVNLLNRRLADAKARLETYREHLDRLSAEAAKFSAMASRLRDRGFDVSVKNGAADGAFSRRKDGGPHLKGRFYDSGKVRFRDLELTAEQFERFTDVLEIKPDPKPVAEIAQVEDADIKTVRDLNWKERGASAWAAKPAHGNYLVRALGGLDGYDVSYRDSKTRTYRRVANVPTLELAKDLAQRDFALGKSLRK